MPGSTTCIAIRLRRTIHQDAYLAVPVSEAVMKKEPEADGSYRLDTDALFREAIRMGDLPEVEWQIEETSTELHPIQRAAPEGRQVYDVHR